MSPSGGVSGTTTLRVSIEENKTGDVRTGAVEFRSLGQNYTLSVKQNYDVEAVVISDASFLAALVAAHDTDGDGILSTKEAAEVRKIECSGKNIGSMAELGEYFKEITYLDCSDNNLSELDVTALTKVVTSENKQTISYTADNGYLTFCIPDTKSITSIKDSNNFENVDSWSYVTQSVTIGAEAVV